MGGAISGCFAALYPELVSHLTLCCPASMHLLTLYLIFNVNIVQFYTVLYSHRNAVSTSCCAISLAISFC